jgi:hypothetical protein
MTKLRFRLPLLMPLALAACATLPPPDREVARMADAIHADAGALYAGLATRQAPDCAYAGHAASYAGLTAQAARLTDHLAARRASAMLQRAASALARAIAAARASHELASARSDDPFGLCLAPAAIALNADALARASMAIANSQDRAGDQ